MSSTNKKALVLFAAIAGFVGWKLYKKVQDADKLNVDIDSVDTKKSGGFLPNIQITLLVKNPTGSTIKINSITGDLFVNNTKVGSINGFIPITIAANSSTKFPIVIVPDYLNAMDIITNIINTRLSTTGTFKGTVIADSFTIPITKTFNFTN